MNEEIKIELPDSTYPIFNSITLDKALMIDEFGTVRYIDSDNNE